MIDTYHQLVLVPLGEGAWRVCDSSVASCDAASVIAYVEQVPPSEGRTDGEPGYEAVWVYGTRGTTRHASIESILTMAADLRTAASSTGKAKGKPKPIAHFPPGGRAALAG